MARFFYPDGLRFECTGCAECCRRPGMVYFTDAELQGVASDLGISRSDLRREYGVEIVDGRWAVEVTEEEPCVFLEDDVCTIHPVRPSQCRTYPFWPEALVSRETWAREASACEGIGRGRRYSPAHVERIERGERET